MKKNPPIKIRAGFMFALPAALYMLVFVGYPMIQNFILSFKNVDVYTFADKAKQSFVGFRNYADLFAGEGAILPSAIVNTLVFTVVSISSSFLSDLGWRFCLIKNLKAVRSLGALR